MEIWKKKTRGERGNEGAWNAHRKRGRKNTREGWRDQEWKKRERAILAGLAPCLRQPAAVLHAQRRGCLVRATRIPPAWHGGDGWQTLRDHVEDTPMCVATTVRRFLHVLVCVVSALACLPVLQVCESVRGFCSCMPGRRARVCLCAGSALACQGVVQVCESVWVLHLHACVT